jgi:Peptidase family M49.
MFNYSDERFADLQLLRYRLNGFEQLTLRQKQYIYALSEATLYGRDIIFDQFGKYNLRIRKMLEAVYTSPFVSHDTDDFRALEVYLKRVWFSNGIYHHYGCEKFQPAFHEDYLRETLKQLPLDSLPLREGETLDDFCNELFPVIFQPEVLPKRMNKNDGDDLVKTSACNYYQDVTQQEVEDFYQQQKEAYQGEEPPSFGLNTTLVKRDGHIQEDVWHIGGKYAQPIEKIVYWLEQAKAFAENDKQVEIIDHLIAYYRTGDLQCFNDYCKEWVSEHEGRIDFVNGFIEVYGDPLCLKGSWEGIVEYKDLEATKRTQAISQNAQWFEDHSPIDPRFRKKEVKGVTANAICAAMLGGR